MKYISHSLQETAQVARKFLAHIPKTKRKHALFVLLSGNLGAGKTAFVKAVAKILGIREKIVSPTFVLMRKYAVPPPLPKRGVPSLSRDGGVRVRRISFTHLIHIDAYRLENKKELTALNLDAIFRDPKNIIFLEWPERVFTRFPHGAKKIMFKFVDEKTRGVDFL